MIDVGEHEKRLIPGPVDTVVFFGGGGLMVECACMVRDAGLRAVIVAAPRHAGTMESEAGCLLTLVELCEKESIPCFVTDDINTLPELPKLTSGRAMGLGYGEAYRFTTETIAMFEGRLYDFMVIRLPEYRGGAHFTWQILRGSRLGCWCFQEINEEMEQGVFDSGRLLKVHEYRIPLEARLPRDFFAVANREGMAFFRTFLQEVQEGKAFTPMVLQENFSVYFPRLHTLTQGWIDWSWTADEIERFVCAFDEPYAGASTTLNGERAFLKGCLHDSTEGGFHPFMAGLIYRISPSGIFVAARNGALLFERVLAADGSDMRPRLKPGMRFVTPRERLEEALAYSPVYDARGLVESKEA